MSNLYDTSATPSTTALDDTDKRVFGALVAAPSARVIMADPVVDDFPGDASTTGTVAIGGSVSGQLESAGDWDWFRVELAAGHVYAFDLKGVDSGSGTLSNPMLRLLNSAGAYLSEDYDSGAGTDARLIHYAGNSGSVYASAQGSYNSVGSYTLAVTDLGPDDHPGTVSTTSILSTNASNTGDIQYFGDQDWFRIDLTAGLIYAFDLKGMGSGGGTLANPLLRLLDGAALMLAYDYDSGVGSDSRLIYSIANSGAYFLTTQDYFYKTGTYTLAATVIGVDDQIGGIDTTGTVAVGGSTTGDIQFRGDQDWFRVNLTAGRVYAIELKGVDSGGGTLSNPQLQFLDGASVYLASDSDSGTGADARLVYSTNTSGTHFIAAAGDPTATGTYTLVITDLDADDHLGGSDTTSTLALGGTATGNIQFSGDQDWLRVELTAGRIYAFDMRGLDSGSGTLPIPALQLLDSASTSLATDIGSGVGNDARLSYSAASDGTYFLVALGPNGGTGTYVLAATDIGVDDHPGASTTSSTLAPGGTATGDIQFTGDQDWFRIDLTAGHFYVLDMKGVDSGGGSLTRPYLILRNNAMTVLASDMESGTGADARLSLYATSTETYYLAAMGVFSTTGTYTLAATDLGADDYAGDTSTIGTLSPGASITGNIQATSDQDWFRIELTAGRLYAFDLKGVDSGGGTLVDPALQLRDGAGVAYLASDGDSGSGLDARLVYMAPTTGSYFLVSKSGGVGTYTLSATDLGTDDHIGGTTTTSTLALGGSITGEIQLATDQDWFRVELVAGTTYLFSLQGASTGNGTLVDPALWLYDSAGNYLAADYDGGEDQDALLAYTATSSGSHFLAARDEFSLYTGNYTLSMRLEDYAGSVLTSGSLQPGASVSGTIDFAGDEDWIRVSLTAHTLYSFTLDGMETGGGTLQDPALQLLESNGAFITGFDDHLTYIPVSSGIYYLAARSASNTLGSYTLSSEIDDYAGGIGTSGSLAMNGSITGRIQGTTDSDWLSITLTANTSYAFSLEGRDSGGGSLIDPLLRLRDSAGNIIASNQDGGFGQDAHLTHIAASSGTYYLSVESQNADAGEIGTYTLSARALGSGYQATPASNVIPLTGTAALDGLMQGSAWQFSGSRVLTYSFNDVIDEGITTLGGPWTEAQKDAVREALLGWEAVANISFVEVPGSATIENNTANIAFGHVGNFLYPAAGLGIFPSPDFANQFLAETTYSRADYPRLEGDVLIDDYASEMQYLSPGDSGFWVGMHELGHALGLKHPFDDGANYRPTFISLGIGYQDSNAWTAMSYNNTSATGYANGYPSTPMLLDIQAIQRIYGTNDSYHGGDNTYYLVDDGALRTLWDTGGNDWLDASGLASGIVLNLEAGSINAFGYQDSVVAIAYGIGIENARGGNVTDTLRGTSAANILDGGPGVDTLEGGLGDDTYRVDNSADSITEYANAGIDSVESTASYTLGAELENLALIGANALTGTGNDLDNLVTGNDYNNTLNGGAGRDTLIGGLGNDTYLVDNRGDQIVEISAQGVDNVHAGLSWALGANLENLTLTGAYRYSGTGNALDNSLTGNAAGNILSGGSGADTLSGGGGNDTYIVDNANDTIQETGADANDGVRAWLDWTLGDNLETLTLLGTRSLDGTGNGLNNTLTGNGSANMLNGAGGNDFLDGASGNDTLTGGAGSDTFAFTTPLNALRNVDTITDFVSGADKIQLSSAIFKDMGFSGSPGTDAFFHAGSVAHDASDRLLYDQATGSLSYDADGTGPLAAVQFAVLSGAPTLLYSDFLVG